MIRQESGPSHRYPDKFPPISHYKSKMIIIIVLFVAVSAVPVPEAIDVSALCPNERCRQWQDQIGEIRGILDHTFFRYDDLKKELSKADFKVNSNFIMISVGAFTMIIAVALKIYDLEARK